MLSNFVALINYLKSTYSHRSIIKALAIREVQTRYVGTFGGLIWSFVNPLLMIAVYWFVFSVGFKVQPSKDIPYIAVFLCGLIPWSLFSETLSANVNVIMINSHLATKTIFPTEILPLVNLVASLITHAIMLVILTVILFVNGIHFSLYNLQFIYYLFALSFFTIGLSWLLSSLNVFYRDIGQILGVTLNLWFWMTPIVWMIDIIPFQYRYYFNFNPMVYIVAGYKHSFIDQVPFWRDLWSGIYFWGISLSLFAIGGLTFKKLKSEFTEVL